MDPDTHPFFDPKTGRPNIWHTPGENGALEFFDGPGFHPRTGKALTEITRDFADKLSRERADSLELEEKERADPLREEKERADRGKAQASEKPPAPVDPDTYPFFDPKTGRPNIWHSAGESGALEFFDGPGFHPRTGKALTEITRDFADKRLRERADRSAKKKSAPTACCVKNKSAPTSCSVKKKSAPMGSPLSKTRHSATLSSEARMRRSYTETICLGWTQRPDASVGL